MRFGPWVGKIPWRRKWQPTLAFLPGKAYGQRRLEGYSPWAAKESGKVQRLSNNSSSKADRTVRREAGSGGRQSRGWSRRAAPLHAAFGGSKRGPRVVLPGEGGAKALRQAHTEAPRRHPQQAPGASEDWKEAGEIAGQASGPTWCRLCV